MNEPAQAVFLGHAMDAVVAAFAKNGRTVDAMLEDAGEPDGAEAEGETHGPALRDIAENEWDAEHREYAEVCERLHRLHEPARLKDKDQERRQCADAGGAKPIVTV